MNHAPPESTIPRDYNFAADILKRNLDAGRGDKTAFIDDRGHYTYRDLAARIERFGQGLRRLGGRREERVLICLQFSSIGASGATTFLTSSGVAASRR